MQRNVQRSQRKLNSLLGLRLCDGKDSGLGPRRPTWSFPDHYDEKIT